MKLMRYNIKISKIRADKHILLRPSAPSSWAHSYIVGSYCTCKALKFLFAKAKEIKQIHGKDKSTDGAVRDKNISYQTQLT